MPITFPSETLEGMRAQSACFVQDGDKPVKLSWLKDGKPLEQDGSIHVSLINEFTSLLIIEHARADHSGNYSCVATNVARQVRTTATLSVSGEYKNTVNSIYKNYTVINSP